MKILYVQDSLGTGGAEKSNAELWYYLQPQNIEIKILVLEHRKEGIENEILEAGFDVHFLEKKHIFSQALEISKVVDDYNPDIVHSVLFNSNLRTRVAKLFRNFYHIESLVNCPYNKFRLNDPNVNQHKLLGYKFIDRFTQGFGVDHFHANAETVAAHYEKELHIKKSRITIIPRGRKRNFVDPIEVLSLKKEINPNNKIQLINVARHEFQKAQDLIVEAIARSEILKKNVLLILVGRNGELTKEINKKISTFKLEMQVKQLGHRNDIYHLLKASDVFVFPSRFEGLPGALIEAESAGLPIVCSNIGNNLEVVVENMNALIFPVDDVEILKIKLEEVVINKKKRIEMGAESLKLFEERFLLENINKQMFEFYKTTKKLDFENPSTHS